MDLLCVELRISSCLYQYITVNVYLVEIVQDVKGQLLFWKGDAYLWVEVYKITALCEKTSAACY